MILQRSTTYWSIGIVLTWHPDGARDHDGTRVPGWSGQLDYLDDGWAGDDDADSGNVSTEGTLRTRYVLRDGNNQTAIRTIIDTLIADATRLGIQLGSAEVPPQLYVPGDGEWEDSPAPEGWREMLAVEAQRIGWSTYGVQTNS